MRLSKKIQRKLAFLWGKLCETQLLTVIRAITFGNERHIAKILSFFNKKLNVGARVIPLNVNIDTSLAGEIQPYEEIKEIIERSPVIGVIDCYCRKTKKNCDYPLHTCIILGNGVFLEDLINSKKAMSVSKEEALRIVEECDKLGLVHNLITFYKDDLYYVICNCCGCCCSVLAPFIRNPESNLVRPSEFVAVVDIEKCVGCGRCVERCWFSARRLVNNKAMVDVSKCMGCGVCVSGCENNATKLIRRKS